MATPEPTASHNSEESDSIMSTPPNLYTDTIGGPATSSLNLDSSIRGTSDSIMSTPPNLYTDTIGGPASSSLNLDSSMRGTSDSPSGSSNNPQIIVSAGQPPSRSAEELRTTPQGSPRMNPQSPPRASSAGPLLMGQRRLSEIPEERGAFSESFPRSMLAQSRLPLPTFPSVPTTSMASVHATGQQSSPVQSATEREQEQSRLPLPVFPSVPTTSISAAQATGQQSSPAPAATDREQEQSSPQTTGQRSSSAPTATAQAQEQSSAQPNQGYWLGLSPSLRRPPQQLTIPYSRCAAPRYTEFGTAVPDLSTEACPPIPQTCPLLTIDPVHGCRRLPGQMASRPRSRPESPRSASPRTSADRAEPASTRRGRPTGNRQAQSFPAEQLVRMEVSCCNARTPCWIVVGRWRWCGSEVRRGSSG